MKYLAGKTFRPTPMTLLPGWRAPCGCSDRLPGDQVKEIRSRLVVYHSTKPVALLLHLGSISQNSRKFQVNVAAESGLGELTWIRRLDTAPSAVWPDNAVYNGTWVDWGWLFSLNEHHGPWSW